MDYIETMKPVNIKTPVGAALQNSNKYEVLSTGTVIKVYSCPLYPKTYGGKLVDHLLTVHKDNPTVMEIAGLPAGQRKKREQLKYQLQRERLIASLGKQ